MSNSGVRVEGMITSGAGFASKVGSALGSGLIGILQNRLACNISASGLKVLA